MFYKNIFPSEHVSRDVTFVMNPCHELVTKHLVTRWDEALTAETSAADNLSVKLYAQKHKGLAGWLALCLKAARPL